MWRERSQIKTKGHPIGRVKIHQMRHIEQHQMTNITVVITIRMDKQKIDATRRKGIKIVQQNTAL
jgi:hypothetical protein